jgi:hypothetical protein
LYDGGFVLTRGSKVIEVGFNNVAGISDSTIKTQAYGVFTVAKTRQVTVFKKDGEKIIMANIIGFIFIPNYDQFADELGTVYTNYLLRDVTKENISQLNLSFGDKLKLAGGQLIHDADKKQGAVSIPLESIRRLEYLNDEGYWLSLKNERAEELTSIRADKAMNLETLNRIVELVNS